MYAINTGNYGDITCTVQSSFYDLTFHPNTSSPLQKHAPLPSLTKLEKASWLQSPKSPQHPSRQFLPYYGGRTPDLILQQAECMQCGLGRWCSRSSPVNHSSLFTLHTPTANK